MALYVCFKFWYISLPSSAEQQGETTKFKVLWGTSARVQIIHSLSRLERRSYQFICSLIIRLQLELPRTNITSASKTNTYYFFIDVFFWRRHCGWLGIPKDSLMSHNTPNQSIVLRPWKQHEDESTRGWRPKTILKS